MKNVAAFVKIHRGMCLMCLVVLILEPLASLAQEPGPEKDVVLSLRVDSSEILQCEPLRFTLSLVNRSPETQQVSAGCVLWGSIYATPEQGASFVCGHPESYGRCLFGEIKLKPGMALHEPGTLLLFREKRHKDPFVFRKPGRYRLKAQIVLNGKPLESREVEIFVKPIPQTEIKPLELFQQMPLARAIQGWELSETSAKQAAKLIAEYPTSMYADHARFFLGIYWYCKLFGDGPPYPPDAAKKSYEMFNTVSSRLGVLRTRALLWMTTVAQYRVPDWRNSPQHKRILVELEAYKPLVATMGLRKPGEAKTSPAPSIIIRRDLNIRYLLPLTDAFAKNKGLVLVQFQQQKPKTPVIVNLDPVLLQSMLWISGTFNVVESYGKQQFLPDRVAVDGKIPVRVKWGGDNNFRRLYCLSQLETDKPKANLFLATGNSKNPLEWTFVGPFDPTEKADLAKMATTLAGFRSGTLEVPNPRWSLVNSGNKWQALLGLVLLRERRELRASDFLSLKNGFIASGDMTIINDWFQETATEHIYLRQALEDALIKLIQQADASIQLSILHTLKELCTYNNYGARESLGVAEKLIRALKGKKQKTKDVKLKKAIQGVLSVFEKEV